MADKLKSLAAQINSGGLAEESVRLEVGWLLIAAQDEFYRQRLIVLSRVDGGNFGSFKAWCEDNIERSYRDCQRCMALARADNPTEAVAAERAKAKDGMAKLRQQREATNVSRPTTDGDDKKQYWLTPPELFKALQLEFNGGEPFDDPCPFPRPPGFDGLAIPWGPANYVNPPFVATDDGGPTAWTRKAIAENKLGKLVLLIMPAVGGCVNMLLEAGAELRPLPRIRWLETTTGEPMPSPPNVTLFILHAQEDRGNHRRHRSMNDLVHTGSRLAAALIRHLHQYVEPGGKWLDPCRGKGAFYRAMPTPRDWCEITEGRDFFSWSERVACAATNPPWSDDEPDTYTKIVRHMFEVADTVMVLTKISTALGTYKRHRHWRSAGHGLREVILIRWQDAEFTNPDGSDKAPEGIALAALIWQRGYEGDPHFNYGWLDGIPEIEAAPAELAAAAD